VKEKEVEQVRNPEIPQTKEKNQRMSGEGTDKHKLF
jgi:hypothetical protein